jgi:hypothetical protein
VVPVLSTPKKSSTEAELRRPRTRTGLFKQRRRPSPPHAGCCWRTRDKAPSRGEETERTRRSRHGLARSTVLGGRAPWAVDGRVRESSPREIRLALSVRCVPAALFHIFYVCSLLLLVGCPWGDLRFNKKKKIAIKCYSSGYVLK